MEQENLRAGRLRKKQLENRGWKENTENITLAKNKHDMKKQWKMKTSEQGVEEEKAWENRGWKEKTKKKEKMKKTIKFQGREFKKRKLEKTKVEKKNENKKPEKNGMKQMNH